MNTTSRLLNSKILQAILTVAMLGMPLEAQVPVTELENIPVFHATAISRSTKSVNFQYRQGSTELALTGTALASKAKGTVRADSKTGATKLTIHADHLPAPWTINDAMLTYVVWAITPEGRPSPVGELAVGTGDEANLSASSELQAFGLIVTAEPYFAVTQPSDVIVMEATITPQTSGTIQTIDAKYELLPPNAYISLLPPARQAQLKIHDKTPVDLLQARHAVVIAESFGAARYADDTLRRASIDLKNAEDFFANNGDKKKVEALSRNVVQLSEDARLISVRRSQADELEKERLTAQQNLTQARTDAERETRQRELAETESRMAQARAEESRQMAETEKRRGDLAITEAANATAAREQAQARAEESRQVAETEKRRSDMAITEAANAAAASEQATARAEESRLTAATEKRRGDMAAMEAANASTARELAQADAQGARRAADAAKQQSELDKVARQQTEQALQQADQTKTAALAAQQKAESERGDANRLLADARIQQSALSDEAEQAKRHATEAEEARKNTREELRRQLNIVLVTTQTPRGLVVNMSDVLFDSAKFGLKPGAREKLAKVAGILQTHPALKLEVEGHTDSIGSEEFNNRLSNSRAQSVRDFLITQGVNATSISFLGKGKSLPVATNDTAAGRQQNRRVEIVVSGADVDSSKPGF